MDPHDPSNSLESIPADNSPCAARKPGQAPAGSLMSIQIRRRTLPREKLPVPPAVPAPRPVPPAPEAIRADPPLAPPGPITPAAPIAPAVLPELAPAAARAFEPPPPAPKAEPRPETKPEAKPEATGPKAAPPAAVPPAVDPGRRMQSSGAPSQAAPSIEPPAAPPVAAPAPKPEPAPAPAPKPAPAPPPAAPAARAPLNAPGIVRYARTGSDTQNADAKKHLAMPKSTPAPPRPTPPAEAEAPAQAPKPMPEAAPEPAPVASRPEGIVSYWLRLRGSQKLPSLADIDEKRIATDWPNSILMRCRSGSRVLEPEKVFAGPAKAPSAAIAGASQSAMDLSPMMLQWLLSLAGDAARDRRPMQDTEAFPSRDKSIRYGAFALPFSEDQSQIDHVLCHVYRVD